MSRNQSSNQSKPHIRRLASAQGLAVVVKMRLGSDLTEAEIAYLALHVARVTNGVNRQDD